MKKLTLFLLILAIIFPAAAENEEEKKPKENRVVPVYDLGDQALGLFVGTVMPLFFDFFYLEGDQRFVGASNYYASPFGGTLGLEWNSYLNNNMTIGFNIGMMFAVTYNNTHMAIPLAGSFKYIFNFFPFSLPLTIDVGICISKISDSIYLGGIIRPGFSFYYKKSTTWDLGGSVKYWWVPELYFGDDPPKEQSAFGNFLEISFSAVYHL